MIGIRDLGDSWGYTNVTTSPKSPNKKIKKMETSNNEGFIPKHGGYRNLITYQKSEIIYDATVYFTNRFFQNTIEQ